MDSLPTSAKLELLLGRLERTGGQDSGVPTAFAARIAARRWAPGDFRPWRAAALGLSQVRRLCPAAYELAEAELEAIRPLPLGARRTRLRRHRRKSLNPALVEALLSEAIRVRPSDSTAALSWIDDGIELLAHCRAHGLRDPEAAPLFARLLAHRANVLRVAELYPEADRTFDHISRSRWVLLLERLEIFAELADLEASLRTDVGRTAEARKLIERAEEIYSLLEDQSGVAKCAVKRAHLAQLSGQPDAALAIYSRLADGVGNAAPVVARRAQQNVALCLTEIGKEAEAEAHLQRHRSLFEGDIPRFDAARLAWIRGLAARGLGRTQEAQTLLLEVRHVFTEAGRQRNIANVDRDLATLRAISPGTSTGPRSSGSKARIEAYRSVC